MTDIDDMTTKMIDLTDSPLTKDERELFQALKSLYDQQHSCRIYELKQFICNSSELGSTKVRFAYNDWAERFELHTNYDQILERFKLVDTL